MNTYKDICEVLGVDRATFDDVIKNKTKYYYSYPILKKSGKKRYIDAPIGLIKQWQEIATRKVLYRFGPHPIAYGFAKNKNPISAAEVHTGQKILVAMDVKNFFNSITDTGLEDLFRYLQGVKPIWTATKNLSMWGNAYTAERKRIDELNQDLIELFTYKGIVPQGAPSSPALSNLYMLRADKLLNKIAAENGYKVSRYADDITFSGNDQDLPGKTIPTTKQILRRWGLRLNPKKIHINRNNRRMRVVGIVVNEKTNIPRETWRNFRAKLHNLKVTQKPVNLKEAQILRGKIEWYKTVNPTRGEQFLEEFGQLNFTDT